MPFLTAAFRFILRFGAKLGLFIAFVLSISLARAQSPGSDFLSIRTAVDDADDSYDPFSDYSEFEEEVEEEADIHFFKNGRFFTFGFLVGMRSFNGQMAQIYGSNTAFGLALTYFFDLRFALQFGFQTGDHRVALKNGPDTLIGSVSFNANSVNLKHYFNTDNVTKGVAELNPYLVGGLSQYSKSMVIGGIDGTARSTALALDAGAGIEIPLLRSKMFLGLQGTYHLVNFTDENEEIFLNGINFGNQAGDIFHVFAILGSNF